MAYFSGYPIIEFREDFSIAPEVKDPVLLKCFFEAEELDMNTQLHPHTYQSLVGKYKTELDRALMYFASSRYVRTANQKSTSTGYQSQTYVNGMPIIYDDRAQRADAEFTKAQVFMDKAIRKLQEDGVLRCSVTSYVKFRRMTPPC